MVSLLKAASLLSTSKKYFNVQLSFILPAHLFFMDIDLGTQLAALSPLKSSNQLLKVRWLDRPDCTFILKWPHLNNLEDCVFFPFVLSVCCRKFEGPSSTSNGSASIHEMWQIGPRLKFKWRVMASETNWTELEKEEEVTHDEEYILMLQQAI